MSLKLVVYFSREAMPVASGVLEPVVFTPKVFCRSCQGSDPDAKASVDRGTAEMLNWKRYSEGVLSFSPGLRAQRATLANTARAVYPNGVMYLETFER